jgi:DNA-binding NtrC family response regulator
MSEKISVLVVDDELGVRESLKLVLMDEYRVLFAETGKEALEVFNANPVEVILLDILLPDVNGIDLIERFKELDPNVEVIMITAVNTTESAVKAIKKGAYEYINKPFFVDDVKTLVSRAIEKTQLVKEVEYLKGELERCQPFEQMVGKDKKMSEIFELISDICDSDGAVLIQGESGTGKELVARAIHNLGRRRNNPFVVVNCSAIPQNLMESQLFGHKRGAFTDATRTTMGKLEIADNGTVFLDDVDMLDTAMQAKLLRVIQEKEFERVGSTKNIKVNVRFVASSNKSLKQLIDKGIFREDLYYRLNVFPIKLPPLRARKGDIPLLLNHFLELYAFKTGTPVKKFAKRAVDALTKYHWPGNVRELENLVERLCTVTRKKLIYIQDVYSPNLGLKKYRGQKLKDAVGTFERKYILDVLENVEWSRKKAAERLGIHRNTLLEKMNELDIKL